MGPNQVTNSIPNHNLAPRALAEELKAIFGSGDHDFGIEDVNNWFTFVTPRHLTDAEKDRVLERRLGSTALEPGELSNMLRRPKRRIAPEREKERGRLSSFREPVVLRPNSLDVVTPWLPDNSPSPLPIQWSPMPVSLEDGYELESFWSSPVRSIDQHNSSTQIHPLPFAPSLVSPLPVELLERRHLPATLSPDRNRDSQYSNATVEAVSILEVPHFDTTTSTVVEARTHLRPACRLCSLLYLLWLGIAALSLVVGLWRSFATGDEGKGFTDAAYVVAVGGFVGWAIQSWHRKSCNGTVWSQRNEGTELSLLRRYNTVDTV